jgi:hypothetical protein
MALKSSYLSNLLETVKKRNSGEPEFIQAVTEVFESLEPVIERRHDLYFTPNIIMENRNRTVNNIMIYNALFVDIDAGRIFHWVYATFPHLTVFGGYCFEDVNMLPSTICS